jgi:cell division protein FtsB
MTNSVDEDEAPPSPASTAPGRRSWLTKRAKLTGRGSGRPSRRSRLVAVGAAIALLGFTGLLVLPAARTWLNQRDQRASDQRKLAFIAAENAKLEDRISALQTPDEIERVAREQYNYAYPGEQVVSVLPPPTPGPLPSTWPYSLVQAIMTARSG